MIIGLLGDAHGNPIGLETCLKALEEARVESIYFLGDSVGYMPDAEAVLRRLESSNALCIRGNHEEMLLGNISVTPSQDAVYRISEARAHLAQSWTAWITEWPIHRELVIDDLRLLLVHGSPFDPIAGYVYPDTDLTQFSELPYDFLLLGHTHRPFIRNTEGVTVVNVGSCGLPRDVGNLASCAVCDTRERTARLLRVAFDTDALLRHLGNRVDESVRACLQRRPGISDIAEPNDE